MERSQIPARQSLGQDWLNALRYWLGGRRGLIALAGLIAVAGVAFNWSWLVAAGAGPLLLGVLPCVAMCAMGLCANRMAGRSCSDRPDVATAASPEAAAPLIPTAEDGRAASRQPDLPALSVQEMVAAGTAADEVERRPALKEGD